MYTRLASVPEYRVVGKPQVRVDARAKATGQAMYAADIALPQMLYGKILRSPFPHARILNIDTTKAQRLPGVKAIVTGKDTTGVRFGFVDSPSYPADEPPLAEDKVRFIGEAVAAVAAINEDIAEEAVNLINVEYQELPAVFDAEAAMKDGAARVHEKLVPATTTAYEDWGMAKRSSQPYEVVNNIGVNRLITYGDIEQGFRESDYVREDRFVIPGTAHAAMEPHAAVASFDAQGNLNAWLTHMSVDFKRFWLAKTLGIPLNKVRVHKTYVGGAFGGKIELYPYEFLAAFLARMTGKPVKIVLSREEVFTACKVSHRMTIDLKMGVKKDGTLRAQHMKVIDDIGAYRGSASIALYLAHIFSNPVYNIPHLRYEGLGVYTNKLGCCPKRGHGAPQTSFAVESQLDMIASELEIDRLELRLRNVRKVGTVLPNGDRLDSCGLTECLYKAAEAINWRASRETNRGLGLGLSAMFNGSRQYPFGSTSVVRLNSDGTATLFCGAAETGQGSDTVVCQIVAEELGLLLDKVALVSSDSELCPPDLGNFLSAGVFVTGRAVKGAAIDARRQLLEHAASLLHTSVDNLEISQEIVRRRDNPGKTVTIAEVARDSERMNQSPILGKSFAESMSMEHAAPPVSQGSFHFTDAYAFTVAAAEVEVNKETGKSQVLRTVVVGDAGFDINPISVQGQLEGQAVMGEGDALFEEVTLDKGQVTNPTFMAYALPGPMDAPQVTALSVETIDPLGPYGAKEAGECARAAVISAIANAVCHASGVRLKTLPFTPDKLQKTLERKPSSKDL